MTTLLTASTETDIKFTRGSNGAIDLTKPVELSATKVGQYSVYFKVKTLGGVESSSSITVNAHDCLTSTITKLL